MIPIVLLVVPIMLVCAGDVRAQEKTKTEHFDRDPGWDGHNNRPKSEPRMVRQDFGYSRTSHAGGEAGEMGGYISPAGEVAYYGAPIPEATFADKLTASGTIACPDGEFHVLLGFFNAGTVNEWRTPNTIVLRLNGRGKHFYAYPEFLTSKWRIGSIEGPREKGFGTRDESGKEKLTEFASGGTVHQWSLTYDPKGDDGKPLLTATIDDVKAIGFPDPAYLADGATFNRFGIMNVMKSADTGGEIYIDNVTINGRTERFDQDPQWEGKNNRNTYPSRLVRPWFDFGFSQTSFAGGKNAGELGGVIFRGDCRYPERMAYYGDRVGPLSLQKPFKAGGKITLTRGITDSSAMIGFFNSAKSMEVSDRQDSGCPKCFVGIVIEGPSKEGFYVYPGYRVDGDGQGSAARAEQPLRIYPDGKSHDWSLAYDPDAAGAKGRITVTLDGRQVSADLAEGHKAAGATFDRFGIVTSWIDGNLVNVYWDDLTYTVAH